MRWTPSRGPVGSAVHLYGARFPSRRLVRIRFGGVALERLRTERGGRFATRLTVPSLSAGRRLVRVKRGSKTLGFVFRILPPGPPPPGPPEPPGASPGSDPLIAAAGDIACDPTFTYFKNGLGTSSRCRQKYTSDLLVDAGLTAVLPLGDIQYECGGYSAFLAAYDPTWGRVKAITRPAIGNHEVHTSGGSGCAAGAAGYFRYFGAAAGDPSKGYYSYDLGAWHLIALNSNCSFVSCSASSSQAQWLRQDLAAHPTRCTLAYWHHPRFTSGTNSPGSSSIKPLFQALYDYGADVVLVGHDHHYERFAPQNPSGARDLATGIREFLVGTGGRGFHPVNTILPNSEVRNNVTFGVLKLALHPAGYDWQFVPEAGASFRDSGSQMCH
jgi:acid phosphatase type 7